MQINGSGKKYVLAVIQLIMEHVKVLSSTNSILNQSLINQAKFDIIQSNLEPSDVPYCTNKKLVEYFILEARCCGWTLVFVDDRKQMF